MIEKISKCNYIIMKISEYSVNEVKRQSGKKYLVFSTEMTKN